MVWGLSGVGKPLGRPMQRLGGKVGTRIDRRGVQTFAPKIDLQVYNDPRRGLTVVQIEMDCMQRQAFALSRA
jgi:hypothetical protein